MASSNGVFGSPWKTYGICTPRFNRKYELMLFRGRKTDYGAQILEPRRCLCAACAPSAVWRQEEARGALGDIATFFDAVIVDAGGEELGRSLRTLQLRMLERPALAAYAQRNGRRGAHVGTPLGVTLSRAGRARCPHRKDTNNKQKYNPAWDSQCGTHGVGRRVCTLFCFVLLCVFGGKERVLWRKERKEK